MYRGGGRIPTSWLWSTARGACHVAGSQGFKGQVGFGAEVRSGHIESMRRWSRAEAPQQNGPRVWLVGETRPPMMPWGC